MKLQGRLGIFKLLGENGDLTPFARLEGLHGVINARVGPALASGVRDPLLTDAEVVYPVAKRGDAQHPVAVDGHAGTFFGDEAIATVEVLRRSVHSKSKRISPVHPSPRAIKEIREGCS